MKSWIAALAIAGSALAACQTTSPAPSTTAPGATTAPSTTAPSTTAPSTTALGAAAQLGAQAPLTGEQLTATLTGARARVDTVSGTHTSVQFAANGTLTGTIVGGGGADDGTWAIKDGRACNTWKVWRGGVERCFRYVALGADRYGGYTDDGALEFVLTVRP